VLPGRSAAGGVGDRNNASLISRSFSLYPLNALYDPDLSHQSSRSSNEKGGKTHLDEFTMT
jgi:hypothetical protein